MKTFMLAIHLLRHRRDLLFQMQRNLGMVKIKVMIMVKEVLVEVLDTSLKSFGRIPRVSVVLRRLAMGNWEWEVVVVRIGSLFASEFEGEEEVAEVVGETDISLLTF